MYKMAQQRYACLTDLNGYFKKSDLLSGLSELEKSQLRTNIGILNYTGEGGQSAPVELTYSALYDLVVRKTLVTGARYIITDYQTIYSSNVLNSSLISFDFSLVINTLHLFIISAIVSR